LRSQKQFATRINSEIWNYNFNETGTAFNSTMLFYRWLMINIKIIPIFKISHMAAYEILNLLLDAKPLYRNYLQMSEYTLITR